MSTQPLPTQSQLISELINTAKTAQKLVDAIRPAKICNDMTASIKFCVASESIGQAIRRLDEAYQAALYQEDKQASSKLQQAGLFDPE